jgi:hypothetical protein
MEGSDSYKKGADAASQDLKAYRWWSLLLGCGGEDILDAHETTYMLNTADRAVHQGVSRERESKESVDRSLYGC